jgi:hypothetical protein
MPPTGGPKTAGLVNDFVDNINDALSAIYIILILFFHAND